MSLKKELGVRHMSNQAVEVSQIHDQAKIVARNIRQVYVMRSSYQ